jgi:hypothetical protein
VTGLTTARGIPLATPRMGERLDLAAPHRGERWWRNASAAGTYGLNSLTT